MTQILGKTAEWRIDSTKHTNIHTYLHTRQHLRNLKKNKLARTMKWVIYAMCNDVFKYFLTYVFCFHFRKPIEVQLQNDLVVKKDNPISIPGWMLRSKIPLWERTDRLKVVRLSMLLELRLQLSKTTYHALFDMQNIASGRNMSDFFPDCFKRWDIFQNNGSLLLYTITFKKWKQRTLFLSNQRVSSIVINQSWTVFCIGT